MEIISLKDVNKYITLIRINFENAYKTQNDEERQLLYRSWYEILKPYPKKVCDAAVLNAIKNAEFAPRIGTIVKEIEKMQSAYEKTESELWAELTAALREVEKNVYCFRFNFIEANGLSQGDNARQRVEDIFNGLSPELKEYCGNQRGLIDLATGDGIKYEKGRFMTQIPTLRQRAKTRRETGDAIAGLIQGMGVFLSAECDSLKRIN